MVDLLGPADAGAINTLTTTSDVTSPVAGDSWYQDCSGGVSGTGTDEVAKYLNRMLQQVRAAIRAGNVPLGNSYDEMLSWAIQSGYANFVGVAGGSANARTGSVDNNPTSIPDGTIFCGYASAPNTGAATFNLQSLGALPVLQRDGTTLNGGEINGIFSVLKYGSNWYLLDTPASEFVSIIKQYNPFIETGVGAVIVVYPFQTSGLAPWAQMGVTGSWSATIPSVFNGVYGNAIVTFDNRWPPSTSSAIPGTSQIQTVSTAAGTDGDSGNAVMTLVRIA